MKAKSENIVIVCLVCVLLVGVIAAVILLCVGDDKKSKGVWWWSGTENAEEYLAFASQNGVTEIYFSVSDFSGEVNDFIGKANELGVDVYALTDSYKMIYDFSILGDWLNEYRAYQTSSENKFCGVHLDIEPHQNPEWREASDEQRTLMVQEYVNFVYSVATAEENRGIKFDFDIPAWLNFSVSLGGETKEAFKFVIYLASRVFVMSYRDSAEQIYSLAEDELAYANGQSKKLFLCVETGLSNEGENITFFEEGKAVLNDELEKLQETIKTNFGENFSNFGISVHHMSAWYDLKS